MQILNAIKSLPWRAAWVATRIFLMVIGLICLGAWFANRQTTAVLFAAALALIAMWALIFHFVRAEFARREARSLRAAEKFLAGKSNRKGTTTKNANQLSARKIFNHTAPPNDQPAPTFDEWRARRRPQFDRLTGAEMFEFR